MTNDFVNPTPSCPPEFAAGRKLGKILVVDDDIGIRRAVARALKPHEIHMASDGDEAITLIQNEQGDFDGIMSDVQMARVCGLELYRWVEQEFPHLAGNFFFITGGSFNASIEQFFGSLKPRVMRKPFDPETLRRTVCEVLLSNAPPPPSSKR